MKLAEISTHAKKHGIVPGHLSKIELIKAIQGKEGNFDCYATAVTAECDQGGCSWRVDCFTDASTATPSIA
jgi:predicted metal-binding protein